MGMTFEARSENGYGKWHFLVWNWVWIWGCGRHTPTTNSKEYPPGLFPTTGWICVCWSQIQLLHVAFVNSHLVRIPTDKFSSSSASCFNVSQFYAILFYFYFCFIKWQLTTNDNTWNWIEHWVITSATGVFISLATKRQYYISHGQPIHDLNLWQMRRAFMSISKRLFYN